MARAKLITTFCIVTTISIALWPSAALAYCVRTPSNTVACLDTIDQQPLNNRSPLILVHGWNHEAIPGAPSPEIWANFITYYQQDVSLRAAFKVYLFKYYSNVTEVTELGVALRDVVDLEIQSDRTGFGSKPLGIVAHSMGGLIARHALTLSNSVGGSLGDRVPVVVTLGTPHHGSMLANGPAMGATVDGVSGGVWRWIWDELLNGLFYPSGSPDWWQVNRSDLLWDNFDRALPAFPGEHNRSLELINGQTRYDGNVIAYAGVLPTCGGQCPCLTTGVPPGQYCHFDTLVRSIFDGARTDGVVPISSALGYKTSNNTESRFRTRPPFENYNHTEMAAGKSDGVLFGQLREDLLATVPTDGRGMDNYADLGNPDDERFQNLRGWGNINPGLLPIGIDSDRTSRYQAIRGESSVDLRVVRSSRGYLLTFRVEDGACDDSFEVFVNERTRVVNYRHGSAGQQFPLHRVEVSSAVIEGDIAKVTFINRARDDCGRSAVYFVRIDPL